MSRQTYSSETKAAVLAALLTGQAASYVSREYNVPASTVKDWLSQMKSGKISPDDPSQKNEIGGLILEYLKANLQALKAQTELFADQKWLSRQGASELAVLHGVMTDKAVRLLEAMSKE